MVVIRDYVGNPTPQCGPPLSIHAGDVIELIFADLHSSWWQVRVAQLNLSLCQHLGPYEKITCRGPRGLGYTQCLCSVIMLNPHCVSPPLSSLSIKKKGKKRKTLSKALKRATSTICLRLAPAVYGSRLIFCFSFTLSVRRAINTPS